MKRREFLAQVGGAAVAPAAAIAQMPWPAKAVNVVVGYPWVGLAAPRATPGSTIASLSGDVRSIISQADITDRFMKLGMEPIANTPDEFAAFINSEIKRWHPLIKKLGIRLD